MHTGGSRRIDIGDGHYVWTKKVGDSSIKFSFFTAVPAATTLIFECFEDFLPPNGIDFYFYDQLDCGNSERTNDPKLWTIERYRDEVEAVRRGLGLEDFFLYGQSWGGILAMEYALAYPRRLRGLIISNMTASASSLEKHLTVLRAQLPAENLLIMDKYEKSNDYDNPEYEKIMTAAYKLYVCRLTLGRIRYSVPSTNLT